MKDSGLWIQAFLLCEAPYFFAVKVYRVGRNTFHGLRYLVQSTSGSYDPAKAGMFTSSLGHKASCRLTTRLISTPMQMPTRLVRKTIFILVDVHIYLFFLKMFLFEINVFFLKVG